MIRDGYLAHDADESPLLRWQIENEVLHAFLIATLTTILAYQTTAIFFDLLLGFKPRGEAEVTDIAVDILAEESSPLSVCASLFRNDFFSRWRFHGFNSR